MPPPNPQLFALTLTTSPEAEDAVAELLLRATGESPIATFDRIRGLSRVVVYLKDPEYFVPERRRELRLGLQSIQACGLETAPARISWSRVKAADWKESWKRHFQPLSIGRVLLVRPSWSSRRPTPGQKELVLDPGLSFGTGQHPTTGFCLKEVVRARPRSGTASLLDVGTGSGILALAAGKLGYSPVRAIDFDPEALTIARENAASNGLGDAVSVSRGDVAKLSIKPRRRYDVVCANLTSDLLSRHATQLVAQAKAQGLLILAGILAEEFPGIQGTFESLGLKTVRSEARREWQSGSFRAP